VSDGEKLDGMLAEMGYIFLDGPEGADLVLYNTCAVRENAEDRIFGNVGALKKAKAENPDMILALCGCMVQQEHIAGIIKKSYPYVDMLFGPSALADFPRLLWERLDRGGRIYDISDPTGDIAEDLPVRRDGAVKAWVPIMYGCDNFCAYCVVPYVRGRERSRDHSRVIGEVEGLLAEGYKEITLLGQNVNSYRSGDVDFVELLRLIDGLPGKFRVRFMTSHPKDCSKSLIDLIAASGHLVKHIHLPVQSGSNRVLELMNRKYTREKYLDIIAYAKERIHGVTFTSDIIIGFPGEVYSDVLDTISLIREVGYQSLFTFMYSKRVGTKAAGMDDTTPEADKKRRFQELLDIQNEITRESYAACVGKTLEVLTEGPGREDGLITGRTESNMIVNLAAPEDMIGRFVKARITGAHGWALTGEIESV
jgi:tRNA-2-methylthio-N6-dimethylallyladenosine synthase